MCVPAGDQGGFGQACVTAGDCQSARCVDGLCSDTCGPGAMLNSCPSGYSCGDLEGDSVCLKNPAPRKGGGLRIAVVELAKSLRLCPYTYWLVDLAVQTQQSTLANQRTGPGEKLCAVSPARPRHPRRLVLGDLVWGTVIEECDECLAWSASECIVKWRMVITITTTTTPTIIQKSGFLSMATSLSC